MQSISMAFILCLLCANTGLAQTPATPTKSCSSQAEYRQFDFWIGEWDVKVKDNQAGTNSVQLILGKCVIFENWSGSRGMNGKSFNIYNAAKKQWQQFWADDQGTVLELNGEFKDGAMRLFGEAPGPSGKLLHRITYTPLPEDRVRQHWEISSDQGKTWTTSFDGLYLRKK
jgi:hypothetical protein